MLKKAEKEAQKNLMANSELKIIQNIYIYIYVKFFTK